MSAYTTQLTEYFKEQIEDKVTEYFYGIQTDPDCELELVRHKDSLSKFPENLQFVKMLTPGIPLFKEIE